MLIQVSWGLIFLDRMPVEKNKSRYAELNSDAGPVSSTCMPLYCYIKYQLSNYIVVFYLLLLFFDNHSSLFMYTRTHTHTCAYDAHTCTHTFPGFHGSVFRLQGGAGETCIPEERLQTGSVQPAGKDTPFQAGRWEGGPPGHLYWWVVRGAAWVGSISLTLSQFMYNTCYVCCETSSRNS